MAKSTSTPRTATPLKRVDFQKDQVFLTMHQTGEGDKGRNVVHYFHGDDDALAEAIASASARAKQIKSTVAVFGPQIRAYEPPPAVKVTEVQLDFAAPDTPKKGSGD